MLMILDTRSSLDPMFKDCQLLTAPGPMLCLYFNNANEFLKRARYTFKSILRKQVFRSANRLTKPRAGGGGEKIARFLTRNGLSG